MSESRKPSGLAGLIRSPLLRIVVVGLIVIVLLAIVSNIAISTMKAQRNHPIEFTPYPNAQVVTKSEKPQSDSQTFSTTDTPQQVLNFYSGRVNQDDGNGCVKRYTGKQVSEDLGQWKGACVVKNALLDADQGLTIEINWQADADGKSGKTIIQVDRYWGG